LFEEFTAMSPMFTLELCAGAGGQALGLESAGFLHAAAVEIDRDACATLRLNRPGWSVLEQDINAFSARAHSGIDLVAGGLPCPPFSKAGKQLGALDERNLFPAGLRIVSEAKPRAVMFENVKGFLEPRFEAYRNQIAQDLRQLGYQVSWRLLNASDYGVPQLRPRVVLLGLQREDALAFRWPVPTEPAKNVGETLLPLMSARGWKGAKAWAEGAKTIAPTLVGGSKKHGGPDLGPTRARQAWALLGVDGGSVAKEAPEPGFIGNPKLTVEMAALVQGFPADWRFAGRKTSAYRQVGNAFPPPVAAAVATEIARAFSLSSSRKVA
jgi:DNA (cytosine-5)-methyltransferase 1